MLNRTGRGWEDGTGEEWEGKERGHRKEERARNRRGDVLPKSWRRSARGEEKKAASFGRGSLRIRASFRR